MDHDNWSDWEDNSYSIEDITIKLNYAKARLEEFRKQYKDDKVTLNIIEPTLIFMVNYWKAELELLQIK